MNYYLMRAWAPLLIFVAYLLYKVAEKYDLVRGDNVFLRVGFLLSPIVPLVYVVASQPEIWVDYGYYLNLNSGVLTLEGLILSVMLGVFILWHTHKGGHSYISSMCSAGLTVVAVGWLYEVPFYHPLEMFINLDILRPNAAYYPLIANSQLLSVVFLYGITRLEGYRPAMPLFLAAALYLAYAAYMYLNANSQGIGWFPQSSLYYLSKFIIRVPSIILVGSMFTGEKR